MDPAKIQRLEISFEISFCAGVDSQRAPSNMRALADDFGHKAEARTPKKSKPSGAGMLTG
jgi:hypothetical protein